MLRRIPGKAGSQTSCSLLSPVTELSVLYQEEASAGHRISLSATFKLKKKKNVGYKVTLSRFLSDKSFQNLDQWAATTDNRYDPGCVLATLREEGGNLLWTGIKDDGTLAAAQKLFVFGPELQPIVAKITGIQTPQPQFR